MAVGFRKAVPGLVNGLVRGRVPVDPAIVRQAQEVVKGVRAQSGAARVFARQVLPTVDGPRQIRSWSEGLLKMNEDVIKGRDLIGNIMPLGSAERSTILKDLRLFAQGAARDSGRLDQIADEGQRIAVLSRDTGLRYTRGAALLDRTDTLIRQHWQNVGQPHIG